MDAPTQTSSGVLHVDDQFDAWNVFPFVEWKPVDVLFGS
jgi:hypothetical protein